MKVKTKKVLVAVLTCLLLSILCTLFFPGNIGKERTIDSVEVVSERSYIKQNVTSITFKPYDVTKVYYKNELLGVLLDDSLIDEMIARKQNELTGEQNSQYNIKLDSDIILIRAKSFWCYENKDAEILDLLDKQGMFVVQAVEVQIVDANKKVVDTIYVSSENEFKDALVRFAKNFIDEASYARIASGDTIASLTTYGSQAMKVYVAETIKSTQTGAPLEWILQSEDDIFNYLCYGKDKEIKYYTVKEYDTVAGVATLNGLTASQLMAINPEIEHIDQALVVGQQLNITYFDSPITVVVENESYVKEVTYPASPIYIKDDSIAAGLLVTEVEPQNGYNDSLYTEIYVNGVLSGYRKDSTKVVVEPVVAVYKIGAGSVNYTGHIVFSLPCANTAITCNYYCYQNHTGVDFINIYDRWGDVLACTDGVVTQNGWSNAAGWFYRIDAGTDIDENGESHHIVVRYGHMRVQGPLEIGTEVTRGMWIGYIGSTGKSSGPHVHVSIYDNGVQMNPCKYLPCELARNW